MSSADGTEDNGFAKRREAGRRNVNEIEHRIPDRTMFFDAVYEAAGDDPANVPWADLKPKAHLLQWLADNPGISAKGGSRSAIDIACGLGDNAEALAAAGYRTVAFDLAEQAVNWARKRFPDSDVDYRVASLFDLPQEWNGAFDLVNECFTLQALPPDMLPKTAEAIASLVKHGGHLLVYSRWRPDGSEANGAPWPLEEKNLGIFSSLGFERESEERFEIHREGGRVIPHSFAVWRRKDA